MKASPAEAIRRFREAARLFHHGEAFERARLASISAAERAVDLQEYARAAHAYLDAAAMARSAGEPGGTILPTAATLELLRSASLTDNQRGRILRRLERSGVELSAKIRPPSAWTGPDHLSARASSVPLRQPGGEKPELRIPPEHLGEVAVSGCAGRHRLTRVMRWYRGRLSARLFAASLRSRVGRAGWRPHWPTPPVIC